MKLLPSDTFTVTTQQPLESVLDRLAAQIEAPQKFRWKRPRHHRPYAGTLSESGFEIRRIIHYRNSFLPNICGRFESSGEGTIVRIQQSLHPIITVFSLFWLSTWYSIAIPVCLSGWLSEDIGVEMLLPLGMPIVVFFIFGCAFRWEADRSRRELTAIILGKSPLAKPAKRRSRKVLWFVAIAAIGIWNAIAFNAFFSSSLPPQSSPTELRSCSEPSTQSPYCNFSIAHTLTGHPTAAAIALSPDGKTLFSGGRDKAIKVWDIETGELKKTLQSDSGAIASLAVSPDGNTVISGSGDRRVRIWDITSEKRPQMLADDTDSHSYLVSRVGISADGKTIVSSAYSEVKIWDRTTGELKTTLPDTEPKTIEWGPISITGSQPRFSLLAIAPDGNTILTRVGSKLVVRDLTGDRKMVLPKKWLADVNAGSIGWDGQTAVTTSYGQPKTHLQIWDLTTAELKAETLVSASRESWGYGDRIALSGDRIFASTTEGLKVWNLETAELEATLNLEPMRHLVASRDGKLLIGMTGDSSTQNAQIQVLQRP
ncbi:hypothetical protein IQ235_11685 [Oscillatoriales cyanobacterium LEGE 11467]|uniref:Uncharacterized protein n=1 Tax=Zarconia navalis LEGE 11467 TaxID=1828826 RepID=A0A928VWC0_9CYAN|nr:hypothetical protein [Zarconia navalis]MBE9041442.1 hypothetical protein [Zarconia navalis LEGE 11467]